jgi:hypothetical protein
MKYDIFTTSLLVAFLPISIAVGMVLGETIAWRMALNNVEKVSSVNYELKTQQTASMVLTEGYDRRVQQVVPAWALYMQAYDNLELGVR